MLSLAVVSVRKARSLYAQALDNPKISRDQELSIFTDDFREISLVGHLQRQDYCGAACRKFLSATPPRIKRKKKIRASR